ncbi:hypothetical protein ACFL3J_01560, partial [Candidatus Omnitrophota bacterium]
MKKNRKTKKERKTMKNSKMLFSSAALIFALVFTGCSATGSYSSFKTDRKILIGDEALEALKYEGLERHPVIVIPGIFGSRLIDSETKEVVWGVFTGQEMIENFSTAQIRELSLPMVE